VSSGTYTGTKLQASPSFILTTILDSHLPLPPTNLGNLGLGASKQPWDQRDEFRPKCCYGTQHCPGDSAGMEAAYIVPDHVVAISSGDH
jgi:hypothetical protein